MANTRGGQDLSHLNYTVLLPYDTSAGMTGGSSVANDLNLYYEVGS